MVGKVISSPFNPFGALHSIYPRSNLNSAPSLASAFRCRSTGLAPIAHPPGRDTDACLFLARSGPRTRMLALIFLTRSYSAIDLPVFKYFKVILFSLALLVSTSTSSDVKTFDIVLISSRLGTFERLIFWSVKIEAAIIGKHAFFEPLIDIVPDRGWPPFIIILSIYGYNFGSVTPVCFIYFPCRSL